MNSAKFLSFPGRVLRPQFRRFCSDESGGKKIENPFGRTLRILKNDMKTLGDKIRGREGEIDIFPSHCDVVVIGGGAIGSSIAYWLKQKIGKGLNVVVVERDPTYKNASTVLSVGGVRQQFSLPENIQMSLFGAEFLRNIKTYLENDINVSFTPYGYLTLASEQSVGQLQSNVNLQTELGAKNVLLTKNELKEKFPWLNVTDIELGCLGLENEGWFDPWALLYGLKRRAIELGAEFVKAEVKGFTFRTMQDVIVQGVTPGTYRSLDRLIVKTPDGEDREIKFSLCILAAGAHSGEIAKMADIGEGQGLLEFPLPIEPRKRFVYCYECKNGPGINTPLTIDTNGTYFRREGLGGLYIAGKSPEIHEEPDASNLDVDYDFFDKVIWPNLAHRVPSFNAIKLRSAWAGYYEYNTFDQNGIVGTHPYYNNLFISSGFSGHGIQHAPAIGRAVAELIVDGEFKTINLERFAFDRVLLGEQVLEANIF